VVALSDEEILEAQFITGSLAGIFGEEIGVRRLGSSLSLYFDDFLRTAGSVRDLP